MVKGLFTHLLLLKHVQIKVVASNEPLMGCGQLPGWLRDKCCIDAIDIFDDKRLEVPCYIQLTCPW